MANDLPLQRISELLRYEEETGNLLWKISRGAAKMGTVAGFLSRGGYIQVRIDYTLYYAHRIIYALAHSQSSLTVIDHIDGNPRNNRLLNLREVSQGVNLQNNKVRGTYARGVRWRAKIETNYKQKHLGCFDTEAEAHAAYLAAKKIYHPEAKRN